MNKAQVSFWKIDNKFDERTFFVNSVILFLIQLVVAFIYTFTYFALDKIWIPLALFVGIIMLLPIVYFNFVITSKRIWDITGVKNLSIILTIVLFIILGICLYIFPIAFFISYFLLLILPGNRYE